MTVSVQTPFNTYTAAVDAQVFAYQFKIASAQDLTVMVEGQTLNLSTDYTVSGVGADTGGNVTLTSKLSGGQRVVAARDMSLVRSTDYQQNGEFPADVVNRDFDRVWLALQSLQANNNRSLKFPIEDQNVADLAATAAERAGKALVFDENGNPIASEGDFVDQVVIVQGLADQAAASASSAANSATLAVSAKDTAVEAASDIDAAKAYVQQYVQGGIGFTNATAYDFGSVADTVTLFPTDFGSVA